MVLSGHLDRWSCVLKSLPQVRPHPWKERPQTIHKELPHGSSPTAKLWHTPKTRGHWCTAAWWRGPPGAFRISSQDSLLSSSSAQLAPVLVQLRHFGTIRSRVGPFQKVPSKGRECFSMKKCAWQDPDQSKSSTSATPTYFGSGKHYWAIRKLVLCREKRYWAFIRLVV